MVGADEALRDEEELERRRLRSYTTLGTVLLAVIVIVVVLLLWRSCVAEEGGQVARGGGGVVDVLPDSTAEPGDIAVWLMPGTQIADVLSRYGLDDTRFAAFGDGTYVISIEGRDAQALVTQMRRDPTLYDAGFVYTENGG